MTSPVARSLRHSGVLAVPQLPQVVPGRPEQPPGRGAEPVDARPRPRLLLRAVGSDARRAATGELVGVSSLQRRDSVVSHREVNAHSRTTQAAIVQVNS